MTDTIEMTPYAGLGEILLSAPITEVKKILAQKGLTFTEEVWEKEKGSIDTPWTVITVPDHMMLFFSTKGHLWKITAYAYPLRLGKHLIQPGMALADVTTIDPGLHFDDWEEVYFSPNGYWIDDTPDWKHVRAISIYTPGLIDDDFDLNNF